MTPPAASESNEAGAPEWRVSDRPVPYPEAVSAMEARVAAIREDAERELIWMLEHPPLYTAGSSALDADLVDPDRFPVHRAGRGGRFTYHGPGQRVVYVMLDLKRRGPDIRMFVSNLEDWIVRSLGRFNLIGERREGRVGIWIDRGRWDNQPGREDKIAAIGVRVRRWVTYHGIAINVEPDLSHFEGIVPCGIGPSVAGLRTGVTSLVDLGLPITMQDLDVALIETFGEVFPSVD